MHRPPNDGWTIPLCLWLSKSMDQLDKRKCPKKVSMEERHPASPNLFCLFTHSSFSAYTKLTYSVLIVKVIEANKTNCLSWWSLTLRTVYSWAKASSDNALPVLLYTRTGRGTLSGGVGDKVHSMTHPSPHILGTLQSPRGWKHPDSNHKSIDHVHAKWG